MTASLWGSMVCDPKSMGLSCHLNTMSGFRNEGFRLFTYISLFVGI